VEEAVVAAVAPAVAVADRRWRSAELEIELRDRASPSRRARLDRNPVPEMVGSRKREEGDRTGRRFLF
jgi:hypothetical protein